MLTILALCLVVSFAGCGLEDDDDDDDDNGGGNTIVNVTESCDRVTTQYTCTEYTGTYWTATSVTTACTDGTIGIACPTSGSVGKCLVDSGNALESTIFYFSTYTQVEAQDVCINTESGTFTPLP